MFSSCYYTSNDLQIYHHHGQITFCAAVSITSKNRASSYIYLHDYPQYIRISHERKLLSTPSFYRQPAFRHCQCPPQRKPTAFCPNRETASREWPWWRRRWRLGGKAPRASAAPRAEATCAAGRTHRTAQEEGRECPADYRPECAAA